jgi:two-component system, NarL family, sensor histidine kinase DegS
MTTGTGTNSKEALIDEVRGEYERIQLRLRELQSLIEQSQAEVRRLQQRSVDVTTQMNRLEANFDTVPRNDIKVVYTNVIDTKTRLLTMQSQLEKVQQDRTQLEHFHKLFEQLLTRLGGLKQGDIPAPIMKDTDVPQGLPIETIIRIVESQEAERQRLARHMHDGPAQSLTNFILQAEICRRLFDRNPDRAGEELDNLKTAASTTFQRVRDFIFDLRPMMLDDLGIAPTMRRYIDAYGEKNKLNTKINIVGEERRRMESHAEVMMFRGLQEVFAYARDVSGAAKLELVLDVSGNPIKAGASFDGKPVEETEVAAEQSKGKIFGLNSLRDRVELIGGTIQIFSIEDEGNHVEITIPAEQFN